MRVTAEQRRVALGSPGRRRVAPAVVAIAAIALVGAPAAAAAPKAPAAPKAVAAPAVVTLGSVAHGRPIPSGFLGLSLEYRTLLSYAGTDPGALDPVFVRLLRNLTPDQAPVLRIGGDSTDWTWWPVPKLRRPPGITYAITPTWLAVARALADQTGLRYILGINLEADSPVIEAAEAHALLSGIGRRSVAALEVGNEPELYPVLGWYRSDGIPVPGRPAGYDFQSFTDEFSSFGQLVPGIATAGPASGNYRWLQDLPQFLSAERSLSVVTVHSYWLNECQAARDLPGYPTVANLLNPHPPSRVARLLPEYAALAHADHLPIRIDEMNSVTCRGRPGVSDVFASALWALNALFEAMSDGIDGVNIHTFPGTANQLFGFTSAGGHWIATVRPEYYGLLMFAQAAPPGAKLLRVAQRNTGQTRVWATIGKDGDTRLVLINDSLTRASSVLVQIPPQAGPIGPAQIEGLLAPSASAKSGVTLDGQSFGAQTTTGALAGPPAMVTLTPATGPEALAPYDIVLPPASAAMVTFPRRS